MIGNLGLPPALIQNNKNGVKKIVRDAGFEIIFTKIWIV